MHSKTPIGYTLNTSTCINCKHVINRSTYSYFDLLCKLDQEPPIIENSEESEDALYQWALGRTVFPWATCSFFEKGDKKQ